MQTNKPFTGITTEWITEEEAYTHKENNVDKMQYMLDNFKRAFPSRTKRLEREWEEKYGSKTYSSESSPKIDWSKPLTCNNTVVTNIEYIQRVNIDPLGLVHVCRLTYKQGYTYYAMYTDEGRTVGNNAGTINVRNKREQVTRYYAISKFSGDVVATANTQWNAKEIAEEKGYNRDDLTFTSHTFTR